MPEKNQQQQKEHQIELEKLQEKNIDILKINSDSDNDNDNGNDNELINIDNNDNNSDNNDDDIKLNKIIENKQKRLKIVKEEIEEEENEEQKEENEKKKENEEQIKEHQHQQKQESQKKNLINNKKKNDDNKKKSIMSSSPILINLPPQSLSPSSSLSLSISSPPPPPILQQQPSLQFPLPSSPLSTPSALLPSLTKISETPLIQQLAKVKSSLLSSSSASSSSTSSSPSPSVTSSTLQYDISTSVLQQQQKEDQLQNQQQHLQLLQKQHLHFLQQLRLYQHKQQSFSSSPLSFLSTFPSSTSSLLSNMPFSNAIINDNNKNDESLYDNENDFLNNLSPSSLETFSPVRMLLSQQQQQQKQLEQQQQHQQQNDEKLLLSYQLKNLQRFGSHYECNINQCIYENLREHFHCYDVPCFGKSLNKKDEIIRHIKWHKKRNESLNYGFLRFSSSDDCSLRFNSSCQHNKKQTHYHCFQPNCDKVYISTSDVQMHSNYHRKDIAIFQEGFQRYRATENCNATYCIFSSQKTTHFHCRRENCNFTFKNKADMEKHKSYHIKDLQLTRDGFKKYLKNEKCPYKQCRFSRVCNHIHCIRKDCFYILHSSGQLLSHKRKHERMDNELAYQNYKILQLPPEAVQLISSSTLSPTTTITSESTLHNTLSIEKNEL
ncbi:transcription factor castor-like, partial [Condylostylus longicornis]|uniref:transcription factor castor-like n=1 Tax=Condylostylus longicornis TaxID=2530218 RepID=UPI00244E21C0